MRISKAGIAPYQPIGEVAPFSDESCYHNFRRAFLDARNGVQSSSLYVRSDSPLYKKLNAIKELMSEIEIED